MKSVVVVDLDVEEDSHDLMAFDRGKVDLDEEEESLCRRTFSPLPERPTWTEMGMMKESEGERERGQ